ncbi:hypothetical protein N9D07_02370 [Alphaproteobacteria bacterium]|nr:hypothetical protein [Alphaproteobacteria bacterium]
MGPPLTGARQLRSLSLGGKIALGPHAQTLFDDMLAAADNGLYATTIILAATIADVALHEGDEGDEGDGGRGLSFLTAPERKGLDWLRGRRNGLVHYEGVVEGMGGAEADYHSLASDADRALQSLTPLMETLEQF